MKNRKLLVLYNKLASLVDDVSDSESLHCSHCDCPDLDQAKVSLNGKTAFLIFSFMQLTMYLEGFDPGAPNP